MMKVFVTGATGFIGSALVPELLQADHKVLGMTRSEKGAELLTNLGADPHFGTIEDLDSLKAGAVQADAVIHLAFNHDFTNFQKNCEDDRKAIEAMGEVLAGSGKPFIGTGGVLVGNPVPGHPVDEDDVRPADGFPRQSEQATLETVEKGVRGIVMRLSQIHDTRKQGLVPYVLAVARQKGVSAYIGDGGNRWPAAHVSDAARLYRLAFEKAEPGAIYHAVGEEGVTMKAIAEAHARGLKVPVVSIKPEDVQAHFGWLAPFAAMDMPSSSALTQKKLNWKPTGPGLIADLDGMDYTQA